MNKILSFEELQKLNEKLKPLLNLRNHIVNDDNSKENTTFKKEILVVISYNIIIKIMIK